MLNELREAFISWQPADGTWIDLGRINLKSGVAVGYNPTDFFRTRAVVEPLTADPTVLREDRLGTLMLLGTARLGRRLDHRGLCTEGDAADRDLPEHRPAELRSDA